LNLDDYADRFKTARLTRDASGVLTVRLHSRGNELWWGALPHRELPDLFAAIATDRENRVVVITGTGDSFITIRDEEAAHGLERGGANATEWEVTINEGMRLLRTLLDIDVPVIAAVNGPTTVHSELAVLADVVLCTPHAYFQDRAHFPIGLVPGDGMQIVWPLLLGPNRGRAFLLTGARLTADEALEAGVVHQVVPVDDLLGVAYGLASQLAVCNPVLLRHTRQVLVRPLKRAIELDLHAGLALEALAAVSGREWYRASSGDRGPSAPTV
jgi:enoyl-CoA hydratase/carnithine racemase